jgi:hypothetical protein
LGGVVFTPPRRVTISGFWYAACIAVVVVGSLSLDRLGESG